ncbi:MAG: hypothetical protein E6K43_01020 [Gammaproteobacteria bacterium]|nr:MAG: hypothetical protein E6K43_01020 [Gammaproteobacteria bacterium]
MKNISRRRLGLGALALAGFVAASSAQSPLRPRAQAQPESPTPGVAHLIAFGTRSPAQWQSATLAKLDGALADLARHAYRVRPGHALEDLHALSPAARFAHAGETAQPLVLVDAVTRGDPQRLLAALLSLGLEHPSLYINDVSGWLPVRQIEAAAARAEVHSLRASMPHTRAGSVTSQGDFAQGSTALRATWPTLDGTGVTVGVLSDSFNCYAVYARAGSGVPATGPTGYASNGFTADAAKDTSTGDLPASVTVLEEAGQLSSQGTCMDFGAPMLLPFGDEGRAMLQIVHDVAPGASLEFHTAVQGEADFANGITQLAAAGAKVIADDVGYFDEPFFQDSLVGQAIDTVASHGVAYFSAAGNNGQLAYDNLAPTFNTPSSPAGEMLLNFDTSIMTTATALPITIAAASTGNPGGLAPGQFVAVVVEWDQPYVTGAPASPGASSQIDVCITGVSGTDIIVNGSTGNPVTTCMGPNSTGVDPLQILIIGNPANATGNTAPETLNLVIGLMNGSPAPGRIKIAIEDNGAGSTINSFFTPSPTLQGHPGAAGAAAVGAAFFLQTPACGTTPALLEPFSSAGGDPILFDTAGTRLPTPGVARHKPDFVAPDGVNNTFLGFVVNATGSGIVQCRNNPQFPLFAGTSAATPHAAAAAALMLQSNPNVTAAQVLTALRTSASAMGATTPDFLSGYGFIEADAALAALPPPAPTISFSPTSITVGMSSTLTWSGINVTGCTASGSWSGAQAVSGTQTITPTAAGNLTYTLTCSNAVGTANKSAMLAVQPAPAGGGGGGGLDVATLLALAALACARRVHTGRRAR